MPHTDTLRTLLSGGLSRDEALVQLRDTGVSPVACVKAWCALHPLDLPDATRLVAWLQATPSQEEQAQHVLARHLTGRGLTRDHRSLETLMQITIADLIEELGPVRPAVLAGFRPDTWPDTRDRLRRLAHQRDTDRWGG